MAESLRFHWRGEKHHCCGMGSIPLIVFPSASAPMPFGFRRNSFTFFVIAEKVATLSPGSALLAACISAHSARFRPPGDAWVENGYAVGWFILGVVTFACLISSVAADEARRYLAGEIYTAVASVVWFMYDWTYRRGALEPTRSLLPEGAQSPTAVENDWRQGRLRN